MMPYSYTITDSSITVTDKATGRVTTVTVDAPNYTLLKRAIESEDWTGVPQHLEVRKSIEAWSKGNFKFQRGKILYRGEEVPGALGVRICTMAAKGEDPAPLLKFWEKLKRNPSWRSVEQLYGFLQHRGIPIQPNGSFLVYKGVKANYTDAHTGKVDNKPGAVNEMERNKVSDDPKTPCHYGFHVGDRSYAESFSEVLVICEVDPADVVCIPYDENHRKMRVCRYRVVGHDSGQLLPGTTYELEGDLGADSEVLPVGDEDDLEPAEEQSSTVGSETKERKMKKPRKTDKKVKIRVSKKFKSMHEMNFKDLLDQPIKDLREYATKVLLITGASKIVGGKVALAKQIAKVRENFEG